MSDHRGSDKKTIVGITEKLKKRQIVLFVGAGISVDSGLPLSRELKVAYFISLLRGTDPSVLRIYNKAREIIRRSLARTMMESVLKLIWDNIGKERTIEALSLFKKGEPNHNHRLIADLVARNFVEHIFTTNFDCCTEKALDEKGYKENINGLFNKMNSYRVLSDNDDFKVGSGITIYKLHGSITTPDTIITTLDQVGKGLGSRKREVLQSLLDSHDFLFLGWSDNDIDITPILYSGNKKFYWSYHKTDANGPIRSLIEAHHGAAIKHRDLVRSISDILHCNVTMEPQGKKIGINRDWAKSIDPFLKMLVVGSILREIRLYKEARMVYDHLLGKIAPSSDIRGLAFHEIGYILLDIGKLSQAIKALSLAKEIFKRFGKQRNELITNNNIGLAYLKLGESKTALKLFSANLALCKHLKDNQLLAMTYSNIGSVHYYIGRWDRASHFYTNALERCKEAGDIRNEIQTCASIGGVALRMGNWESSLRNYNDALILSEKIGDISSQVKVRVDIGILNSQIGDIEKALDCYRIAGDLAQKANLTLEMGIVESNIGRLRFDVGEIDEAFLRYDSARPLLEEAGSKHHLAELHLNMGLGFLFRAELEEALACFRKAAAYSKQSHYHHNLAQCCANIGSVYYRKGELEKSLQYYKASIKAFSRLGLIPKQEIAKVKTNMANILSDLKQYSYANQLLREAFAIFNDLGDNLGVSQIHSGLGTIMNEKGEHISALKHHFKSVEFSEKVQDRLGIVQSYINIGVSYRELGKLHEARFFLNKGLGLAMDINAAYEADIIKSILMEL